MLIYETSSGEKIYRRDDSIIVYFPGPRRVVSTARLNGGYREDLQAVFNHHIPPGDHKPADLPGGSVEGYLEYLTGRLNLPYRHTAGLLTAARMENASIKTADYRELAVTAVVTGGVEVNGGRAGDPARHYELDGQWTFVGGTINIILLIDGNLPPHTLVRAIVTATEAKAAALQELVAPSRYSHGIATGSGTDQIIAVSNVQCRHSFTDAGKHSKLGELIGRAVKVAVKEALDKQTGLNPLRQCNFLVRLERYVIGLDDFWRLAQSDGIGLPRELYLERLRRLATDERLVALAATLLHLLDEYEWGLLSGGATLEAGRNFIRAYVPSAAVDEGKGSEPVNYLIKMFIRAVNEIITKQEKAFLP
ncbi:protein of unknown function DUF105 [Desulfofundulus kuznetsovii DSM 6115]|uniref:Adenosylcobinamide amidohydrolase n=1 Tax=Desulfofundulus kuznetsovii (strain DSM 6115 / VKM B-1805 / 17) TaxID=760568 RepID=A0AAU8PUG7_DESK7|nr:protein of unknown function DUF105 [Desulfofundulus kuznetsovii DSM 6115]